MRGSRWAIWSVFLVAFLVAALGSAPAAADGKFFPRTSVTASPGIPAQRALVRFKDGIETLTVASMLDAEGQSFGWILPVPGKLTRVEAASPGLLTTLSYAVQPKIRHFVGEEFALAVILVLVVLVWVIERLLNQPRTAWQSLAIAGAIAAAVMLGLPLFLTAGGGARGVSQPGVAAWSRETVGSYDVAVLSAKDADALDAWLTENGYAGLSAPERAVVTDYIRDGWHFVTAKLRREGSGLASPHPLSVTFPVEQPVYPLRLTAFASGDVYLELFVLADRRAQALHLTRHVADALRPPRWKNDPPHQTMVGDFVQLAHPALVDVMWPGCMLTRLAGTLRPEQMDRDIAIALGGGSPMRRTYYTRKAAWRWSCMIALLTWAAGMVAGLVLLNWWRRHRPGARARLARLMIVVTAVSLLLWVGLAAALPTIEVKTGMMRARAHSQMEQVGRAAPMLLAERPELAGDTEAFAAAFEKQLGARGLTNGFLGGSVRQEDSPGNYTLTADERGLLLRIYDGTGRPHDTILAKPDQPESGKQP